MVPEGREPDCRKDDADDVLVDVGRPLPEVDIGRLLVELTTVRDGDPEGADGEEPESCVSGWLLLELAGRPPVRLLEPDGRPADRLLAPDGLPPERLLEPGRADPPSELEPPAPVDERTPDCPPNEKPPPDARDMAAAELHTGSRQQ